MFHEDRTSSCVGALKATARAQRRRERSPKNEDNSSEHAKIMGMHSTMVEFTSGS